MNWRLITGVACIASAVLGLREQVQTTAASTSVGISGVSSPSQVEPSRNIITSQISPTPKLEEIARSITVKVLTQESSGSGILIQNTIFNT